jgi:drug/metabolite transporter (DMT)-like permease
LAAYAGFYRALELGPIAVVSPIASANGAEIGEVAIKSAVAAAYPVMPILVGQFALRERIAWHQLAGVAGVPCGMVVLSLG